MDETTKLVIATSMRSMLAKGWLSISTIDECLKLAGIIPVGGAYRQLHALHCIHFDQMPRELAEKIPVLINQTFDGLNIEDLMRAATPALEHHGGKALQRLLGGGSP